MAENAAIARPYAQAVFELADDTALLTQWSNVLRAAANVVADPEIALLISRPGIDRTALVGIIFDVTAQTIDGGSKTPREFRNLLRLLADNGRLPALGDIAQRFEKLKAEVQNRIDVVLIAANPVDEARQIRIAGALKKRLGREVNMNFQLDETLIGGARLQADDLVIDGSVRIGLEKLASALTN
jgi:F-type H+-transporting ATPase subunit delta